jgi:hypothetical protein
MTPAPTLLARPRVVVTTLGRFLIDLPARPLTAEETALLCEELERQLWELSPELVPVEREEPSS